MAPAIARRPSAPPAAISVSSTSGPSRVYAQDERQGRALHPDRPARMGLRSGLPNLGPPRRCVADLAGRGGALNTALLQRQADGPARPHLTGHAHARASGPHAAVLDGEGLTSPTGAQATIRRQMHAPGSIKLGRFSTGRPGQNGANAKSKYRDSLLHHGRVPLLKGAGPARPSI